METKLHQFELRFLVICETNILVNQFMNYFTSTLKVMKNDALAGDSYNSENGHDM